MYICTQILMWPLEKGQIAKSAALLWHSCFFQKPGDVTSIILTSGLLS